MDIYDYLKSDHEYVARLFKQFEESKIQERKKQIADLITEELLVHAHAEQETFYKALEKFVSTNEDAKHGLKEHKEIENQISLIKNSKEFGSSFVKKIDKLKEMVEHHVSEEEGSIFRHAKKVLSEEEAYVIKEQMHYLKQHLLLALKKNKSSKLLSLTKRIKSKATPAGKKVIAKKSANKAAFSDKKAKGTYKSTVKKSSHSMK